MLGVATLLDMIAPSALLALTFVIGVGFTFYMPAQSASINELVTRPEVPQAVALGAVAMNVSRAVGPALAGAVAAWLGSGNAFLVSAVLFVGMIFVVRGWKRQEQALPGVPERVMSGIASGIRFVRHSAPMRAIVIRNLSFAVSPARCGRCCRSSHATSWAWAPAASAFSSEASAPARSLARWPFPGC